MTLLKRQLRDCILSWRWLVVLGITGVILYVQYATSFRPVWLLPPINPTFLNYMLLFNTFGMGTSIFTMILPFLAAWIGSSVYATERHSGRLTFITARSNARAVARTSLLSGFISGGLAGIAPLFTSMIIGIIKKPHMELVDGTMPTDGRTSFYPIIEAKSAFYPLYQTHQVLLLLFIFVYVFVFSGLVAMLGVCVSFFTQYRYVEVIIPFLALTLWWVATDLLNAYGLSQVNFLYISRPTTIYNLIGFVLMPAIMTGVSAILYELRVKNYVG